MTKSKFFSSFELRPWVMLILISLLSMITIFQVGRLPQNNKETLFLDYDLKHRYQELASNFGWKDQLLIRVKQPQRQIVDWEKQDFLSLKNFLSTFNVDSFLSPESLTHQISMEKWLEFYQLHPELENPLADGESFMIWANLPNLDGNQQGHFFDSLMGMSLNGPVEMMGLPYLNDQLNRMGQSVQDDLVPVVLALTFFFNLLYYRLWWASLFSFATSLLSLGIGALTLKLMFGEANIITTSVPLISFVIVQSLNFHFISGIYTYGTIEKVFKKKLRPMLLMALTTAIGFLALSTSSLEAIDQFSFASTLAQSLATFLVIILWWLTLKGLHFSARTFFQLKFLFSPRSISRRLAYAITALCLILGLIGYSRLPVMVEALYFFPTQHKLRTDFKSIESRVGGPSRLDVIFPDFKFEATQIREFVFNEKRLFETIHSKYPFIKLQSLGQMLSESNLIYTGNKSLPDTDPALFALLTQIPSAAKAGFIADNFYRLALRMPTLPTKEYEKIVETVQHEMNKIYGAKSYELSGLYYTLVQSQKALINSLFYGLVTSIFLVCLIVGVTFKSIKSFLNFLIVNLAPLGAASTVLWLSGTEIHVGIIKIYSISFGMMVDSTIHLLYGIKEYGQHAEKNHNFIQSTLGPIYLSTLVTIFSFLVFCIHPFLPIKQFGLFLGFVLFLGLIFDVSVFPRMESAQQRS